MLKNIFEANLKLYNKNAAKKLLFLIRNFENVGNNEEKTITRLENEVKLIWRWCKVPKMYKNAEPEQIYDFFKIEVIMLPDKNC